MTAEQAKQHPWLAEKIERKAVDLLKKNKFNAKSAFKKAIDVVKAVNKMQLAPARKHTMSQENLLADLRPKEDQLVDGNLLVIDKKSTDDKK